MVLVSELVLGDEQGTISIGSWRGEEVGGGGDVGLLLASRMGLVDYNFEEHMSHA